MVAATRTINPLHFEDLEPHRFEDLVRQLIYDFRNWSSIEAVGRSGSDEGVDIRATEKIVTTETTSSEDDGAEFEKEQASAERIWIIQCKRERSIGPTKVARIASDYLSRLEKAPYGYMLIASCNFSKKARDAFRTATGFFGIEEYLLWGKAEVEDQLFLPKNDHLLFAYFGISLQVRRRSIKTELRSKLALKRKLVKELGDIRQTLHKMVLIRDPRDETYPHIDEKISSLAELRWRYWQVYGFQPLDHIAFVTKSCFAYADWNKQRWDAVLEMDDSWPHHPSLTGTPEEEENHSKNRNKYCRFWSEAIPKENQAWYKELRLIPFERILAVDEIGDAYHEPPHLLVEYREGGRPFEDRVIQIIESASSYDRRREVVGEGSRTEYFPEEIPELPEK
jgi:Restriction endonuclease